MKGRKKEERKKEGEREGEGEGEGEGQRDKPEDEKTSEDRDLTAARWWSESAAGNQAQSLSVLLRKKRPRRRR